jgi:hypothetical protein
MMLTILQRRLAALIASLMLFCAQGALADPGQVVVGTYVNKIQELGFKDNKYTLDFFIWFRWKPEGPLADYKPLDSFEIINGKIEDKSSVVEKTVGGINYASVRVRATMAENWKLANYPFDAHAMAVHIEDSAKSTDELVFVPDTANSRLGDEIDLAGWAESNYAASVVSKLYRTNYGDPTLPTDARSEFSRFVFSMQIERESYGSALKLLSTVLLATAVAFVAFLVKPSDLDARFGMGVGSLFAVAASAFIAASSVPDSGVMTLADQVHMVALAFIFVSLLMSSLCLKFEVTGREQLAFRIDRWCLVLFPLAFYGWAAWAILKAVR